MSTACHLCFTKALNAESENFIAKRVTKKKCLLRGPAVKTPEANKKNLHVCSSSIQHPQKFTRQRSVQVQTVERSRTHAERLGIDIKWRPGTLKQVATVREREREAAVRLHDATHGSIKQLYCISSTNTGPATPLLSDWTLSSTTVQILHPWLTPTGKGDKARPSLTLRGYSWYRIGLLVRSKTRWTKVGCFCFFQFKLFLKNVWLHLRIQHRW